MSLVRRGGDFIQKGSCRMNNHVEIVQLEEKKYIGIPVTSSFQNHDPKRIEEAKEIFMNRRHEIKNAVNLEQYVCPHFSSEVLFTYFFGMEVHHLDAVPEGMIGFAVPVHKYAKIRSGQDPYEVIYRYLSHHGIQNDPRAISLEVYPFDRPVWPAEVDVYVPIKE